MDDKVLASWNGMMLGALARADAVLGDEAYRAAAEKNLAFLQEQTVGRPGQNALSPLAAGRARFRPIVDSIRRPALGHARSL